MADTTTLALSAVTKDGSAVTQDTFSPADESISSDEQWHLKIECVTGAGSTIAVSHFASAKRLIVVNTDGANFVNVTHDNAAGATVVTKILAGETYMTPDFDPSATFKIVADTAAVICDILILGS